MPSTGRQRPVRQNDQRDNLAFNSARLLANASAKNLVFRPETGRKERESGKRQSTDEESPKRDRHFLAQTTHIHHVLWIRVMVMDMLCPMLHTMNHRT